MSQRDPVETAVRIRAWQKTKGVCVLCHRRIDGVREPWTVKQAVPSECDPGSSRLLGPAHACCPGIGHDAEDTKEPLGRTTFAKRGLPFGRKSPLKRKMSGRVVQREK
jgi:hypothetical protein